jgi:hypothetical protein
MPPDKQQNSTMVKRSMFILVLVLLLVTNVGWFGVFLDRSLALSDAGSEIDQQEKVAKTLGVLLVELPKKNGPSASGDLASCKTSRVDCERKRAKA